MGELYWQAVDSSWDVSFFVAIDSIFQIISATNVIAIIRTF